MDNSLHSAEIAVDELQTSSAIPHEEVGGTEEEHHVHLPNPSLWPLLLSAAILVTMAGLLFIPDNPWLTIVAAPFVLVGIVGWALENPTAPSKERFITNSAVAGSQSKFKIGQDVIGKDREEIGVVQARFSRYILVDRGGLSTRVYYVPLRFIEDDIQNNIIHLTISEDALYAGGLDMVPDDLYEESPELGVPQTKGIPMFARGPLSPAETGHYNYGPNFPGINTDAAGSYRPEEVRPIPQKYVAERRKVYTTGKRVPARALRAE